MSRAQTTGNIVERFNTIGLLIILEAV